MSINIQSGIKRIYIVLASFYMIYISFISLEWVNSAQDTYELLITSVSCEKLEETISNREKIEKMLGGKAVMDYVINAINEDISVSGKKVKKKLIDDAYELENFDSFLKRNKLEKEKIIFTDKSMGCHAIVDYKFLEKYGVFFIYLGVLGLLPAIIVYFLLRFIINGFRKRK
jgi:hypothetical protein